MPSRPAKEVSPTEDLTGIQFSDAQKAKIDQIKQKTKQKTDMVALDERLNSDQKDAMLGGYRRLERIEIFQALTPEQLKEAHKNYDARRAAERAEENKVQQPQREVPK